MLPEVTPPVVGRLLGVSEFTLPVEGRSPPLLFELEDIAVLGRCAVELPTPVETPGRCVTSPVMDEPAGLKSFPLFVLPDSPGFLEGVVEVTGRLVVFISLESCEYRWLKLSPPTERESVFLGESSSLPSPLREVPLLPEYFPLVLDTLFLCQ